LFDREPTYEVSQFFPLARALADPTLLAVPTSTPWHSVEDLADDAKKRPGQIPYGSSGPYGTLHVAMEMFAAAAGIKLQRVPYRGAGPALNGLLSGTVQALASAPGVLKPQVEAGNLRVLANWGAKRIGSFPNVPTFKELGFDDVKFYIWAGLIRWSRGYARRCGKGLPVPRSCGHSRPPEVSRPIRTRRSLRSLSKSTAPGLSRR
jgi:tripartite-type tricarboxylate transporter receptor subunit TctC